MNAHDNGAQGAPTGKGSRKTIYILVGAAAVVVAGGLYARSHQDAALEQRASTVATRTVAVVKPDASPEAQIELPARIEAWSTAPIYARVDGYLRRWDKDIGARVIAGEQLGVIDTPDLDQDLEAARAQVALARTEAQLAGTTANRWNTLVQTQMVSKQDADERTAESHAKNAAQGAAQAAMTRLSALQGYRVLRAPFAGVVTARNTDVGALIQSGAASAQPLFVVSDVSKLRIYVNLPQRYLSEVSIGSKAVLKAPGLTSQDLVATVTSLSDSIRSDSGAMQLQLTVDNAESKLLPGAYATATFQGKFAGQGVALPPNTLMFGKDGVRVAVVSPDFTVRLVDVAVAKDMGKVVVVSGPLSEKDTVISSPPDGLKSGDKVQFAPPAAKA